MTLKKINDLTVKSSPVATDELELQETANGPSRKATLQALVQAIKPPIASLTLKSTPVGTDEIELQETSAGASRKGTLASLVSAVVGAIANADSATKKNVRELTFPFYYPESYSAVGDGVTDDSTPMQNAVNAIIAAGSGTLLLREKTYYVPSGLLISSGVGIYGTGTIGGPGMRIATGGSVIKGNNTNPGIYYHNTALGSPPADSNAVYAGAITGVRIENIGFTSVTRGIHIGDLYNQGFFYSIFRNLHVDNFTEWGFYFENFSLSLFENLIAMQGNTGATGGMYFGCSSGTAYAHGNSSINYLFWDNNDNSKFRGIIFEARGGSSALNDVNGSHIQTNNNGVKVTQAATMSNGSANITITDGTKFKVDMPVTVSATQNGFTVNRSYFITSLAGNVIQVSEFKGGTAIVATGNTAVNIITYGFPGLEICGVGDLGVNYIQPSTFTGIDMEGFGTSMVLVQNAEVDLTFGTIFNDYGNKSANSICFRYARGNWKSVWGVTVDSESATRQLTCLGANVRSVYAPSIGLVTGTQGLGLSISTSKNGLETGLETDIESHLFRFGVGGMRIRIPIKLRTSVSTSTNLAMWWPNGNCIAYTGGANATWTLPQLVSGDYTTSTSDMGAGLEITNCTTGAFTLTLNCYAGQNFNRDSGKTSVVLAKGECIFLRANYDGTNPFWQVISKSASI